VVSLMCIPCEVVKQQERVNFTLLMLVLVLNTLLLQYMHAKVTDHKLLYEMQGSGCEHDLLVFCF